MPPKPRVLREIGPPHLTEGERDHDEEHAGEAYHDEPDEKSRGASQEHGGRKRHTRRPFQEQREPGHGVGAETEEQRMPQRDHAGIAGDEIEAHGEDRPDRDLTEPIRTGVTGDVPCRERTNEKHHRHDVPAHLLGARHAACRAGSKPPGRSTSTSAMTA